MTGSRHRGTQIQVERVFEPHRRRRWRSRASPGMRFTVANQPVHCSWETRLLSPLICLGTLPPVLFVPFSGPHNAGLGVHMDFHLVDRWRLRVARHRLETLDAECAINHSVREMAPRRGYLFIRTSRSIGALSLEAA